MSIEVVIVDYLNPQQASDLVNLLNHYAQDEMGGGQPLSENTRANLPGALAERSNAFSLICYINGQPAGLTNCFETFSTFKCKPSINIHDLIVVNEFRGQGVSQVMLKKVEEVARDKGCGNITLEVLEGNKGAQQAYRKFGFSGYELDPTMGKAMFWEKPVVV